MSLVKTLHDPHDIIEKAPIGIYTSTPQGRYIFANPALADSFGYASPEDLMDSITDIAAQIYYDPADREEFKRLLERDGEVVNHEYRMLRKDGTVFWVSINARVVKDEQGRIVAYQGFNQVITAERQARDSVKETIQKLLTILDNVDFIVYVVDMESYELLFVNKFVREKLAVIEGQECWNLLPGNTGPCRFCNTKDLLDDSGNATGFHRREFQDTSNNMWYDCHAMAVQWTDGRMVKLVISIDITERKKAEEALAREKKLFQTILDNIPVMITRYDPDINMLYLNKEVNKVLGWQTEEVQDIDLMEKVYPDPEYRREVMEYMNQAVQEWRELTLRTKSGDINFSEWSNIRLADGTQVGIGIDITPDKKAEEENRRIHSLLETAGRIARFGGWRVNLSDNNVYMSSQVAAIYEAPPGYAPTMEEAIGFYAPEWREKASRVFKRCATEGVPFDEEMEIITLKGNRIWIRTTGEPIYDEKGKIRQIAGAFQDISERRRTSQALEVSLKEKETLLQEVHHRVKNNLAVVSALLDMQRQEVDDPGATAVLSDLTTRIRSIVLVHEHLYQSKDVAGIDLQDYFNTLLEDLKSSMDLQNNIHCEVRARGIKVGLDIAVPCGMLVNELVINAIKHAFPDGKTHDGRSEPEIKVKMHAEGRQYRIVVSDNGVGFPGDVDLNNSESFGLRIVRMIGRHQLGGKLELDRASGTRVTFTFKPRHKEKPMTGECAPGSPPLAEPAN